MHKKEFKKYYFIKNFNKRNIDKQGKNTTIIYRNYKEKCKVSKILFLKNYCRKKGFKFILSNNIKLSIKLNLDGAYLPSFNKSFKHLSYSLNKKFALIGSAHNLKEIRIKEKQKVNEIFLSSLFKKNNNYLGMYRFRTISNFSHNKIIALGGLSDSNLKLVYLTKAIGIAGISFFNKKKAPKKGPF